MDIQSASSSWFPLSSNAYFNISLAFILKSCQLGPLLSDQERKEDEDSTIISQLDTDPDSSESDTDASFSVQEAFSWLLGSGGRVEEEEKGGGSYGSSSWWREETPPSDDCQDWVHTAFAVSFSSASVLQVVLGLVATVLLCMIIVRVLWRKVPDRGTSKKSLTKSNQDLLQHNKDQTEVSTIGATSSANFSEKGDGCEATLSLVAAPAPKMPVVIMLGDRGNRRMPDSSADWSASVATRTDSGTFLRHTVDQLSSQLDWILGVGGAGGDADPSSPTSSLSSTASSLLTPRLQRKAASGSVLRRPRWGRTLTTIPMPLGPDSSSSSSSDGKAMMLRLMGKVWETHSCMGWTPPQDLDLDLGGVQQDPGLSSVLQFYHQTCPVPAEQWSASCLMVDYFLTLLQLELTSSTSDLVPLKVAELRGFGSASAATCIGRADRFNIQMVVRLRAFSEMTVYDCETCDDVPAGRLVLGVKETGGSGGASFSSLVRKDRVGDSFGSFLSAPEVSKACQRVLSTALDRLRLKHKGLLDRFPFTFHLDHYTDLLLHLDTRLLNGAGLGISGIRLRFTPAVRVCPEGYHPLPSLYAVPPWNVKPEDQVKSRVQSRMILRSQGVGSDLLWQMNSCEVTQAFMTSAKERLRGAGVTHGCQTMCQQLLRAAFSSSGKDSLLTTGELPTHVLDCVVLFLLLESPASSWRLSCLSDRFSDCVHFLRSAVQSSWMPGFIPHNPHLLKAMPALQWLPLIGSSRQENLLAGVGSEDAETMLSYMEGRLTETGLRRCVKEDYSTEMWEYEFFIFG